MTQFDGAPRDWTRKQLKWAVTFQRGHDLPDDAREEGPVPVYAGGGITGWHKESCANPPGIVTGRYGTIGEFHLVAAPYWPLNTALYSIDLHNNEPEYLRYLLEYIAPLFHVHAGKSAVPGVDRNDIHTIQVAIPPRELQTRVLTILRRESRHFDRLVAAKQRLLDLLAEKRKAIIATAVTRGLDLKMKLRDSGVSWLGEIPAHWEFWKVGHLARVGNGSTPERDKAAYWSDGSFPWLNSSVVNQDEVTSSDQFVTETALRECHLPRLQPGTVLVAITGQGKTRGQAVVLSIEATINQHMAFVAPDTKLIDAWFLRWSFYRAYDYLRSISDDAGGTKGALTCEDVASLRIPVPPLHEQRAIAEHIARETAKLDAVRAATERTIALLKERHAALIAAAVTGQLDVGAAA